MARLERMRKEYISETWTGKFEELKGILIEKLQDLSEDNLNRVSFNIKKTFPDPSDTDYIFLVSTELHEES